MEGKDEFKKIDIKNRTCNYFDYAMKIININLKDILLDEKKLENSLIYDIYNYFYMLNATAY